MPVKIPKSERKYARLVAKKLSKKERVELKKQWVKAYRGRKFAKVEEIR